MIVGEVAAYLKASRATIFRMLKRKELPGFKIGSDFRFRRADIEEWIVKKEQTTFEKP
jgi:excisionase family DNA binding protein